MSKPVTDPVMCPQCGNTDTTKMMALALVWINLATGNKEGHDDEIENGSTVECRVCEYQGGLYRYTETHQEAKPQVVTVALADIESDAAREVAERTFADYDEDSCGMFTVTTPMMRIAVENALFRQGIAFETYDYDKAATDG